MTEVRLNEVRDSLNLTDGCIIDGDQDSVTFAIKVPRSTLRANHHFLVAASEAATDARPAPAVCSQPVKSVTHWAKRSIKALPAIAGAATALVVLSAAVVWAHNEIVPAVDIQSMVPDRPVLAPGEPLVMINTARHNRPCKITYSHTVTRDDDGQVVFSDSRAARHTGVSDGYETFTSTIALPKLPAGFYTLGIIGDFNCGTLDDHTLALAKTHFTVAGS